MATQLKNTLVFADLAAGASVVLPHGLDSGSGSVEPDVIVVPSAELDVVADDTSVTLTNNGPGPLSGSVLVEAWHTIERAFGDAADLNLPVKPYVIYGGAASVAPPTPPEPPQPEFALVTTTIYARSTGSDVTGDGTLANPFRTFQRAIREVPSVIPAGTRYIIDLTGIGVEVLPAGYAMPTFQSAKSGLGLNLAQGTHFPFQTALDIVATPQPASTVPVADTTINAGVVTTHADTGLKSVQDVTKAWPVNALKGKILLSAGGAFGSGIIASNTADTIELTTDTTPTFPATIVEPSAVLAGTLSGGYSLQAPNECPMSWNAIGFTANGNTSSIWATGSGQVGFAFCDIEGGALDVTDPGCLLWWNYIHGAGGWSSSGGAVNFRFSFIESTVFTLVAVSKIWFRASILQACGPVTTAIPITSSLNAAINFFVGNSRIRSSTGTAAVIFAGTNGRMASVTIENAVGKGVHACLSQGYLRLNRVRGTGNAGFGLHVDDGMYVFVEDALTDISGTAGNLKVGNLATRTWADFRAPATGLPLKSQIDLLYDPTLGASGQQVTGTGSRARQP